jgi:hypothetical protein
LAIYRRLVAGAATPADLDEIRAWPVARRVAYLGSLLRGGAIAALEGVRGYEGVTAIVAALDDETTRTAALDGLRAIARDVPERYVHALFHPRPEVRREALTGQLSLQQGKLALYLRADPACADLAAKLQWPDEALPVAIELYEAGHVTASELVEAMDRVGVAQLRALYESELARPPEVVDAYLDGIATTGLTPPPGRDILDVIVRAIGEAGATERMLDVFIETVQPVKNRVVSRRAVVALLGQIASGTRTPALVGACVALEPRVLLVAGFIGDAAGAATRALFRFRWPVRPTRKQIVKLLGAVRDDLALAVAVVGFLPAKRLSLLRDSLGQDEIVRRLVASDHGWDEILRLPVETPAIELNWLSLVEKVEYKRYIALAGRAIGVLAGKRLDAFIEQLPRRHRPPAYLSAVASYATASDEKLAHVCKAIASRADKAALAAVLRGVLDPVAPRVASALVRSAPLRALGDAADELPDAHAAALVAVLTVDPAPRDTELALAASFSARKVPAVAAWCADITKPAIAAAAEPQLLPRRALTTPEAERIAKCAPNDLRAALAPALAGAVTRLTDALAAREAKPNVWACVALIGCADPLTAVATQLERFVDHQPSFSREVDDAACMWRRADELPLLAQAKLWRWEHHAFKLASWIEDNGGALRALLLADLLPGRFARDAIWKGVSEALVLLRYRDVPRFRTQATEELAQHCAKGIDRDIGTHAARIVAALVESRVVPIEWVRATLLDRIADAGVDAREYVGRIVRLVGIAEAPPAAPPPPQVVLDEIRACADIEQLAAWCLDPRPQVVQEAALALTVLGEESRIARLLVETAELPQPIPLLTTILLWESEPALVLVRDIAQRPGLPPPWQFYIALSLHMRGEAGALSLALAAVRARGGGWYFRRDDWDALVRVADIVTCAIEAADSPHHHAYQRAIQILLSLTRPDDRVRAALVRFLEVEDDRPLHLRVSVARKLAELGDATGLPLLIEYIVDVHAEDWPYTLQLVPREHMRTVAQAIVDASLIGGHHVASEKRMWLVLQRMRDMKFLDDASLGELYLRVLEHASTQATRRNAASLVVMADSIDRVERVADVFAWGVRRGIELGGRLFRFHLTASERELGHTRVDGDRIFVSALPMLRGEAHGRDIVEGLVLHEIGHHVYHRSEEAQKIWQQAHKEGIGHFLNLIADEHLERNLRGVNQEYGDKLKRLDAYAFQHAPQEIKVNVLLDALRASAAPALIAADLQVAYDEQSVRMRRGAILTELDRKGHPVARFARALRMNLGNRTGDPLTAAALALCGKDLKSLDMRGLYELTKQLVAMFGGTIRIAQVFGGPEGLAFGERDEDVYGAGLDDEILQREVERILDPRRSKRGPKKPIERLQINVNPDEHFDKISRVVRVRGAEEDHRAVAHQVARHSARLRTYLDELGLRWEPMRARTQGRALDKTRLRALVTRNDPRILIARNPIRRTDLFLGTLIDCSGSMSVGQNLDRAKRFGILVAEAVRNLPGVEARFFGFTDFEIYDAGSATDCQVAALATAGGNNDAAALYHAANVALSSQKRAKVLIMISDGLPTECSVAALKGLVVNLTKRRNIVCAQVAVRRLDEVAFPNYVVLDDNELDVAVAKFGRMIGDLARRSLAS